jgi:anti-sigma factor RsiW
MSRTELSESDFHAFIDGELDAGRRRNVAALIEADPALRAKADLHRADREQLRRIYGPLIEEKLPARLLRPFIAKPAQHRPVWAWTGAAGLAAAAALLLLLGPGPGGDPKDALLAEAIAVRGGNVAPEQQVAADSADDALVAKTMAAAIRIPDLGQKGYRLTGLGVYPDHAHGRAVQLNYRNGEGRLLTVYLHRPTGVDRYVILPERDGKRACIVETQDLSVVMLGEMSEQEMLQTEQLTYGALSL